MTFLDPAAGKIIVASPFWALNGVSIFSANLVRDLCRRGYDAEIILTESDTPLVTPDKALLPYPTDIPMHKLPVTPPHSWGQQWGRMVRYLEDRAPCIYIPNSDYRHSLVSAHLANDVRVVAVAHSDDPLHYDHVSRLGAYWNAVVTVSPRIAERLAQMMPSIAPRLTTIPIGVPIPEQPPPTRRRVAGEPLKLIYHGVLNQNQKRVLDFPRLLAQLQTQGVPVEMTIIGNGSERDALAAAAQPFIEAGTLQMLPSVPHSDMLQLLETHDVYVLMSAYEGMPNALIEAMGRGCVPVVTDIRSGVPNLVQDGRNGYKVGVGDVAAFADRIAALHADDDRRCRLAEQAYATVDQGGFRVRDMTDRYLRLFHQVHQDALNGRFRRQRGLLRLPPTDLNGLDIFPIQWEREFKGVGSFPSSREDFEAYRAAVTGAQRKQLPTFDWSLVTRPAYQLIVAAPPDRLSGVAKFSAELVRFLQGQNIPAHLLQTDPHEQSAAPLSLPAAVPLRSLEIDKRMSWPQRWRRLLAYLEAHAPCIYIPNCDWGLSAVTPRLSPEVMVVGIVHSADPQQYEQVERLGRSWNAVVAVSGVIADQILQTTTITDPLFPTRVYTIPYGVPLPPRVRQIPQQTVLKVIYSGHLAESQRIFDLPRIMTALVAQQVPVELTIIGGGAGQEALLEQCQALLAAGQVRFLGDLPQPLALEFLSRSDVCLFPAEFEGAPISVLEAMAHGCVPVVGVRGEGLSAFIEDGVNGYRVPVGVIEAFAGRLQQLQANPQQRLALAAQARQTIINEHSLARMDERYLLLFERVARQARSGSYRRLPGEITPPAGLRQMSWGGRLRQALRAWRAGIIGGAAARRDD